MFGWFKSKPQPPEQSLDEVKTILESCSTMELLGRMGARCQYFRNRAATGLYTRFAPYTLNRVATLDQVVADRLFELLQENAALKGISVEPTKSGTITIDQTTRSQIEKHCLASIVYR